MGINMAAKVSHAGQPALQSEKRASRRQRVLKGASAAFNLEFSSLPCTVRDISDVGAKLEFSDAVSVPKRFVLHVEIDGYKIECERVRQIGRHCAVRFVSEKKPTRVHRHQVLNTSENALSERFKQEFAKREAVSRTNEPVSPSEAHHRPNAPRSPAFGKRT